MGTRSRIGVMHGDVCKSIYVHWDGYLRGVGRTLLDHYDSAKANHLVALGDASSLAREVELPEGVAHSFDAPNENITAFYGRDRGETGVEFRVSHTFEDFLDLCGSCYAEYYYIMRDGVWYCGDTYSGTELSGKMVPLAQALTWEELSRVAA